MNRQWKEAKEAYQASDVPPELTFTVASAVRKGEREYRRRRAGRRALATTLAACACFALMLNVNPGFAEAVEQVPVLGQLARIFTATQYKVDDRDHLIDVRLPEIALTGHTDLEQHINTEIRTRIDQVLQEAEDRAREAREAYVETGGVEEDFIPIIINVDYEVKCQNSEYLSFLVYKTETLASAYTETYTYNLDLKTGKELTLQDILGSDYWETANAAVRAGIAERSKEPGNSFFGDDEFAEGFTSIRDDQRFYLNSAGNPVVIFDKYEIAPGYMGAQEFEVARP